MPRNQQQHRSQFQRPTPTTAFQLERSAAMTNHECRNKAHREFEMRKVGEILSISFTLRDQLRARKVVTRSRARSTGKYPSWKMNRMIQWESTHEQNAFRLLDSDPRVVAFREQPCKVEYINSGIVHYHFPDLLVELGESKELWEVKTEAEAAKPEVSDRTALLAAHLPAWGYGYRVVLANDLLKQPRLSNANLLLEHGRRPIDLWDREQLRQRLQALGFFTWSAACSGAYREKGRGSICRLVLEGALTFDTTLPISAVTVFIPIKGAL